MVQKQRAACSSKHCGLTREDLGHPEKLTIMGLPPIFMHYIVFEFWFDGMLRRSFGGMAAPQISRKGARSCI